MTAPSDILAERFRTAITRGLPVTEPDGRRGMAHDNHQDFYRWERIVERIACETYGDHLSPDQLDEVDAIAAHLWDDGLRSAILAWAEGTGEEEHKRRVERRKSA